MKYAVADFGDRLWMISTQMATGVNFQGWVSIDEGVLYKRVGWSERYVRTKAPKSELDFRFSCVLEVERDRWKRINRESPWKVYGGS